MKQHRALRRGMAALAWAVAGAATGPIAAAETTPYPALKPIHIIAPTGAGGSLDAMARIVAAKLTLLTNQQVVVENMPGAAGMIGAGAVAKAAPDGYTLLAASNGNLSTTRALFKSVPYDAVKDFAPVTLVDYNPYVLLANPKLPVKDIADLIRLAKEKPGQINVASSGNGSTPHLALELLNMLAGIKLQHVPYKTSAAAVTSVISGETSLMFDGIASGLPQVTGGKLRALGVASKQPLPSLPGVPPIADTVPGFAADNWAGILMPAGTPAPVVQQMHDYIAEVLLMPDVRESFSRLGLEPAGSTPQQFGTFLRAEIAKWTQVIEVAGVRPD
jgi:tripartite-type tricarboxylate transporter receptor subunit TctC